MSSKKWKIDERKFHQILAIIIFVASIVLMYGGYSFLMLEYPVKHDVNGYYLDPAPLASPPILTKMYASPEEFSIIGGYHIALAIAGFGCTLIFWHISRKMTVKYGYTKG